ncbi:hypothetical protein [Aestuariivirga sp.]|uniref:hypothetical protein n=1 Tax=Aestuariivirga sp. TaxID=2650926 RepID=UPI00391DEACC
MPAAHGKFLVLVMHPHRQQFADMLEIAREIGKSAPEIAIHITNPKSTGADVPDWKWRLPTLTISFGNLGRFLPRRGRILQNKAIKKLEQCQRFRSLGIASPHAERFDFGHDYDEAKFGRFAVLKPLPLEMTSLVKNILLCETRRLSTLTKSDFPPDHFLRLAPALVQQFIDTGPRPEYFRVLTLLGEPILWMRVKSACEQVALVAGESAVIPAVIDPRTTYSAAAGNFLELIEFEVPDDVLAFARKVNEGFPHIPLQACDIVREAATGVLHVLEINAGGNTWDFSSRRVAGAREKLGGRDRLLQLYDPWPRAASAIIRKVNELAS